MASEIINNTAIAHYADEETIIARCTPQGDGALALIRISGLHSIAIATKISKLASGKKLLDLPSHTIHYGFIVDELENHIDQVMFILMHGPKTFTGENVVEITTHNNPFIINHIIERAIKAGARLADRGEFTKRAFLNKKIDLIQAESINELIHAQTEMALKMSLAQIEGSLSNHIHLLEQKLLKALAYAEASFEFIEEEGIEFADQISLLITETLESIAVLKKTFCQQQQIRQGIRIALLGSVNAGKSSLFNVLLGKNRAIVTSVPGTTRDVIEASIYKHGNYQTIIDTAGIRKTANNIEQEGIRRSTEEANNADIILLVYDGSKKLNHEEQSTYLNLVRQYKNKIIIVRNKIDLGDNGNQINEYEEINFSCKEKNNIELLEMAIKRKVKSLFKKLDSPFLLNQRQYNLLIELEKKLEKIVPMLEKNVAYELISFHLNDALTHISEFSGKTITKRCMDSIFQTFCIGK